MTLTLPRLILNALAANTTFTTNQFPYAPTSVRLAIQRLRKQGHIIESKGNGVYARPVTTFTEANTDAAV